MRPLNTSFIEKATCDLAILEIAKTRPIACHLKPWLSSTLRSFDFMEAELVNLLSQLHSKVSGIQEFENNTGVPAII